ncbi:MAG: hypothetical protein HYZ52_01315 [Candidatus Omnitrophica bacterium]|nr:hypothetical protein [Candidatus Omnitrophota bacterium]
MKKAILTGMLLTAMCSAAFADASATTTSGTEKDFGKSMGNIVGKLNPFGWPFFKEQEKKYNERKAAAAHQ